MENLKKGDLVSLKKEALELSYVKCRKEYTNIYEGKSGVVIGIAGTGKVAVQFDERCFTSNTVVSSHDNGCHGKGRIHYCWYFPEGCLKYETLTKDNNNIKSLSDLDYLAIGIYN